jgi:hypothetical protein
MELKKKFVLRNIVGETILVPIGQDNEAFNGLITINELGRFIWDNYENAKDEDDLLQKILDEYEVEKEVAKADLDEFLQTLKNAEII